MNKIGLLVPNTNLTVENELQLLFNKNFFNSNNETFYIYKLDNKTKYTEDKIKFLKEIANDCNKKIEQMQHIGINKIYSFCTSASIISNEKMISNPADAIVEMANYFKIKEAMLITPYDNEIGDSVKEFLKDNKIDILKSINLDLLHSEEYFNFGKEKLEKIILENYKKKYKNIIISCTNLPTIHLIRKIEERLNIKIISSNYCQFYKIKMELKKENE